MTITVDDQGNTAHGESKSDTKVVQVTVERVNDAPMIIVPFNQVVEEDMEIAIGGVSIYDVDETMKDNLSFDMRSTSRYRVSLRVLDG